MPVCSLVAHKLPSSKARKWSQLLAILPIYFLQICYGMNSGYPAILTPQLREKCCSEFIITENEESSIVSIDYLATPFICILSGFLQQKLGPKKVLMIASISYLLSWLSAACASSVLHLYLSRVLVGTSHAFLTTTVYTVEVSSQDMRGTFCLLESALRCFGSLSIYILGYVFRWKSIAAYASVIPFSALVMCFFIPESPVFLMKKRRHSQAKNVLKSLYGSSYKIDEELQIIEDNLLKRKENISDKSSYIRHISLHPEVYKPFLIICFLTLTQQFGGMSIIRSYVVKIFNEIFGSHDSISEKAYIAAIIIGTVRLLSSVTLSLLLRRYKRRILYFLSASLTIVFLMSFATTSLLLHFSSFFSKTTTLFYLSVFNASGIAFSVQLGVQTLPNLLSGELFPSDIRAFCKGVTRSSSFLLLVISLKIFPHLRESLGMYGTFYLFALLLFLSLPIIYYILPETKDIGLELIQSYFTPPKTTFYVNIKKDAEIDTGQ